MHDVNWKAGFINPECTQSASQPHLQTAPIPLIRGGSGTRKATLHCNQKWKSKQKTAIHSHDSSFLCPSQERTKIRYRTHTPSQLHCFLVPFETDPTLCLDQRPKGVSLALAQHQVGAAKGLALGSALRLVVNLSHMGRGQLPNFLDFYCESLEAGKLQPGQKGKLPP